MSRMVAVTLLCLGIYSASAQTVARPPQKHAPPVWAPQFIWKFDHHALPKGTVPKEMIASLRLSGVTITLEGESELEALPARFGGEIGSQGDAADSLGWLCLHGSDAVGPWVLWLESGEIDGPYVGGFQWRRVARSGSGRNVRWWKTLNACLSFGIAVS